VSEGNGLDARELALKETATRLSTAATAVHASIVEVKPYAVSMRWMPLLMGFVGIGLAANSALLYLILMTLMQR